MIARHHTRRRALGIAAGACAVLVGRVGEARDARRHEVSTEAPRTAYPRLVRRVQQILVERGYDPGPVDGLWGPRTEAALRAFQRDHGLEVDGTLDEESTLDTLFHR